ncbi:hypothetical protein [Nocardioides sp. SLBN-35]|uniref:hypothetical protein n=1 Tax=Nocardioides sp. SLBN-35 TaxID=2768445 RepID=UPI00114D5D9D|nr:hypothetical protein [Nocardioides sp. SLBN-35]TQK69992.1 hypothetical protein FBY23_1759 [Nocardioides sp. SLBN-35]
MRPHFLGAARSRPAVPVFRRLLSMLLAAAVALLGLVAVSAATSPAAHAVDPTPVKNGVPPVIFDDPAVPDDGPTVGRPAFAHPGFWTPSDATVTLTWYREGSTDPLGTGSVLMVPFEALGEKLRVSATATAPGRTPTTVVSKPSAPVLAGTPIAYAKPAIFGTPEVGSTLAAWEGSWSETPDTYAYRWFEAGTAAPIGTAKDLVVPASAAGKAITVEVTVSKAEWNDGAATSDPVTVAAPGEAPLTNVAKPAISEHPAVGALALAHPGVWSSEPDSITAEWFRSGSSTPFHTGSDLAVPVPPEALGETLTVKVTAHKAGRDDATATSASSDVVVKGTLHNVEEPAIFGSPVVGGTVEAWPGSWFPAPATTSYRWIVDGASVGTGKTLVVPAAAAGKELTVEVTTTKTAYDDAVVSSEPVSVTAPANPVKNLTAPSIEGTLQVGATVTVNTGTWDPGDVTKTVEWYRSGSETPIPNGTGTSLEIPADAEGEMLSVVVKGSKPGLTDAYAYSAPRGPVLAAGGTQVVENLVAPAITPDPEVGQVVGAHPGVWSAQPDSVTLQWFVAGASQPFHTGTELFVLVPPAAAGKTLTVRAVAAKDGYTSGEATSDPSDVVAEGTLHAVSAPAVYGKAIPGATVVAWEGVWPAGPDDFDYRWLVEGSATPVGTAKELVVPAGTAGKKLSVEVTAKKAGYTDAVAHSADVTIETPGTTAVQNVRAPEILLAPGSGLPKVGDLIGASVGAWNPWPADASGYDVEWYRSGSAQPIGTGVFLVVPSSAAGQQLTVKVTAKRAGYLDGSAFSAPVLVLSAAQSPGCGTASTALAAATVAQADATAALVQAKAKVTKLKAKKKAAKKLGKKAKVAKLKAKLAKARSAVAAAQLGLAKADADLASAKAKHASSC